MPLWCSDGFDAKFVPLLPGCAVKFDNSFRCVPLPLHTVSHNCERCEAIIAKGLTSRTNRYKLLQHFLPHWSILVRCYKLLAVPLAWVARKLTPLTYSTGLQLVEGAAPKPLSLS